MSIHVALHHKTHYRYERPVTLGPQVVRLRPAPHSRTRILSYSLKINPTGHFINWQQDPQSNFLARLVFPEKTRSFSVEVDLIAEMAVFNPFDFFLEPDCERVPFSYDKSLDHELAPFLLKNDYGSKFAAYVVKTRLDLLSPDAKGEQPNTNNFLVASRSTRRSVMKFVWSRVFKRRRKRSKRAADRVGIQPGCSCSCCGIWDLLRGLSVDI